MAKLITQLSRGPSCIAFTKYLSYMKRLPNTRLQNDFLYSTLDGNYFGKARAQRGVNSVSMRQATFVRRTGCYGPSPEQFVTWYTQNKN